MPSHFMQLLNKRRNDRLKQNVKRYASLHRLAGNDQIAKKFKTSEAEISSILSGRSPNINRLASELAALKKDNRRLIGVADAVSRSVKRSDKSQKPADDGAAQNV